MLLSRLRKANIPHLCPTFQVVAMRMGRQGMKWPTMLRVTLPRS